MGAEDAITAVINGAERIFENRSALQDYIENEINAWRWLVENNTAHSPAARDIYNALFFAPLKPLLDRFNPANAQYGDFTIGTSTNQYMESSSPDGLLVDKAREKYGNVIATFLLLYMTDSNRKLLLGQSSQIRGFSENPALAYERAVGIQIALTSHDISGLVGDVRINSLDVILGNFQTEVDSSIEKIDERTNDMNNHIKTTKEQIDKSASSIRRSLKRRTNSYRNIALKVKIESKKTKEASDKSLSEARAQLATAKETYEDQVDLEASVTYWRARQATHEELKTKWLLVSIGFMILTFAALLIYYSFNGVTGIAKLIHTDPVVQLAVQAPASANAPYLAPQAMSANAQQVLIRPYSDISFIVADLAGAALLITLMAVLIRISLRQFNTNSHLALDAEERVTFTKTYLALLNEGKLKSDDDRRLVLESLFRPSQLGGVVDTPFSSPIELILKTLTDRKPSP